MRPSRGKRIVAPGTAASKPGSFGQHLVAPPPDRELGIVMAQSPELETAPAFSDSIIDAVRQPLVVLDEATCVVLANRAFYLAFNIEPAAVIGRPFANQFDGPTMGRCPERLHSEAGVIEDPALEIALPLLRRRYLRIRGPRQ